MRLPGLTISSCTATALVHHRKPHLQQGLSVRWRVMVPPRRSRPGVEVPLPCSQTATVQGASSPPSWQRPRRSCSSGRATSGTRLTTRPVRVGRQRPAVRTRPVEPGRCRPGRRITLSCCALPFLTYAVAESINPLGHEVKLSPAELERIGLYLLKQHRALPLGTKFSQAGLKRYFGQDKSIRF